jgi:hypothetical protein
MLQNVRDLIADIYIYIYKYELLMLKYILIY